MRAVDHSFRVLYSELAQRSLDAAFSADFSIEGRFVTAESRGRRYWYFDLPDGSGGKRRRYVGPVCQRRSESRPAQRSKTRPVDRARR